MSDTEIKFQLRCCYTSSPSWHPIGEYDSEMVAKQKAANIKEREETTYQIVSIITTRSVVDTFTVPAYVPSIEEIAEEVIMMSDGSFHVEWGDDYSALSLDDQAKVEEIVWQEIDSCSCCGWHFNVNHLGSHDDADGQVCDSCYNDLEEQANEDEDEEYE